MTDLTRDALEFTAEQACLAHGPHVPVDPKLATPHLILGAGEHLTNVEKLGANRSRFRGKLSTTSIEDFVAYTLGRKQDVGGGVPPVFVDGQHMSATAFFNLGTPDIAGHGDDLALLVLPKTGPFEALWDILDNRIDQKRLAEFLEDWREHVRAFSEFDEEAGLNPMPLGKAIAAVRQVTIESRQQADSSVGNFKADTTSLESVEARSAHVLPPYLEFNCEPYMALPRRKFLLRVSVITSNGIAFVVRLVRKPDVLEAIAQDFKDRLAAGLKEGATLTVGNFSIGA